MIGPDNTIEQELIKNISEGLHQSTKLETDDKVLARVTDGIYRLPGSAIRELISNAYDADAENVYVETDVPRFNSMTIRDDGSGMSIDTLVNMLRHIGGSAKRTNRGITLKVTDSVDTSISAIKKRKLIGKIGIGLFSVAQLTRDFEIITKQKGNDFYLRAKVQLFNYSDEIPTQEKLDGERGKSFQTGNVDIWTEKTENIDAHGTDILLHNIKKSARDQLRSVDIWGQTENETIADEHQDDVLDSSKAILPDFHVGYLSNDKDGTATYTSNSDRKPSLPWDESTHPDTKFLNLYEGILNKTKNAVSPKLNFILDNYLNMIWTLGLSIPLEYIEKHPFELNKNEISDIYALSNKNRGQAEDLFDKIEGNISIGDALEFKTHKIKYDFNVYIDGLKLFRPIKYTDLPQSKAMVKKPIMFVGKYRPNLGGVDVTDSGGDLEFEAYVFWTPKVSPRDHNGSLIRIHNASGILFDETFMKHQVAEYTIKSQLIAEIFVSRGLESALNIDRESFNIAHPHYQIVMRWLHGAIRQVVNKYKQIKKNTQSNINIDIEDAFTSSLNKIVERSYKSNLKDPLERSNLVLIDDDNNIIDDSNNIEILNNENIVDEQFTQSLDEVYDSFIVTKSKLDEVLFPIKKQKSKKRNLISRSQAILQILESYNLLENLTVEKQERLVLDLIEVLSVEI
ncbi:ATP-binding protein [Proteus sp. FME41]|uniref:ATP-binding protein n=1 Tax=Proteus sp. FME41 TaxID=2742608 RepID=UPI001867603F|nr:ATP-binding protein [Proteus sp. FME41]